MKSVNKEINLHYNKACSIAVDHVEKMARKILKEHTNLKEFIMAHGSYFFTLKSGGHLDPFTQKNE